MERAKNTARAFSIERSTDEALALYEHLLEKKFVHRRAEYNVWTTALRMIKAEWDVLKGVAGAAADAALSVHEPGGKTKP